MVVVRTSNERDAHIGCGTLVEGNGDRKGAAISPVGLGDGETWLGKALVKVRRDIDFDPELLWELRSSVREVRLGVATRDQNTAVGKELQDDVSGDVPKEQTWVVSQAYRGFRVVKTSNDRVVQDRDALMDRLAGIVQKGGQIGEVRESKPSHTLFSTVHDQKGAVRKRCTNIELGVSE